jgi:hypothetical protein
VEEGSNLICTATYKKSEMEDGSMEAAQERFWVVFNTTALFPPKCKVVCITFPPRGRTKPISGILKCSRNFIWPMGR